VSIPASEVARALGATLALLPLSTYRSISASWNDDGRMVTVTLNVTVTDDDDVEVEP
jgi:hypothetical protein